MALKSALVSVVLVASAAVASAQCSANNYIQDGAPSALRDCQPLAELKQLPPAEMSEQDRSLADSRHAELVEAARFYGFNLDDPGWTYQQAVSPLLRRHVLLSFTNATPADRASRFTAIVPASPQEKVQVVPAFARGLHPYLPGWQAKGSYSVFNRLLLSERGEQPISRNSDWIDYAVLYLTLAGRTPSVPTETDSIKANWDLSRRGGTTPVILVAKSGAATIVFSDLQEDKRTASWKLAFNKQGQILKAERQERTPIAVKYMQTENQTTAPPEAH
jgi:hypothetical protein